MGLLPKHHKHHPRDPHEIEAEQARLDAEARQDEIDTVRAVMQRYQPGEGIRFGASTRCPACGAAGFVVSSDTTTGNCINYCLECHTDWVISLRALEAVAREEAATVPMLTVEEDLAVEATPEVLETFLRQSADQHEGITSF